MGTAAYNLVRVRGASEDLKEFELKAYKTESEAFCMEQLVSIPDYLTSKDYMSAEELAFRYLVYGAKWVGAFGVLIEKNETSLKEKIPVNMVKSIITELPLPSKLSIIRTALINLLSHLPF